MFDYVAFISFSLIVMVYGQQVGTIVAETHPALSWQNCTINGGCTTQTSSQVVLDSNWRWIHSTASTADCYYGNTWNASLCPDGATCAANCALDGADYAGTYGIVATGNALTLSFATSTGDPYGTGSRVYLMANETEYQKFNLLNQEFSFDVDVAKLPCGFNGALYLAQMDADGGMARFPTNKAGAKYGTGYCDSRCPQDIKFIDGMANSVGWTPSSSDANAGTGQYGTCCNEMDIWEANSDAATFIAHPCTVQGQTLCTATACGTIDQYASVCDPDGCDFNSYRMGAQTFYGPGMTVDTTQTFTVVTQFITDNGTTSGTLSEIRRFYLQDGVVIDNSNVNVAGMSTSYNSITTPYCNDQKEAFGDVADFQAKGGLANLSEAMNSGMVLVFSIWDDPATNMDWLDSVYPANTNPATPGVVRGTCAANPLTVPIIGATPSVTFSNIMVGEIGSIISGPGPVSVSPSSTLSGSTTASAPSATQTKYGQCGGIGWTGLTTCVVGSTCTVGTPYYSQCL